ncbi:YraN family protein [Actinomyces sp. ZJ308]|uniref:YraN family protein n=1 Tax=Actinomyces sp. ZJ308 TaxID=2708342 RepID=UPI0014228D00|nr:YraN family protein [Actinomyces sp. ZJ308]
MTDQVTATATGTTVIAVRSSGGVPIESTGNPRDAGTSAAGPSHLLTGRYGEDLAATYLEDIGWRILERNWRPDHGLRGELDIIALEPAPADREPGGAPTDLDRTRRCSKRPTLVVVEVKTRSSLRQGPPAAAVDPRKITRLRALAAAWAATHETPHTGLRLDVISILLRDARPALLRHHRAVGASWG